MSETQENPRIFISYSWSNSEHIDWVISLAERLTSDGVLVTIDKWDLKEGHDKFDFMESMVKSTEIDKVLVILDRGYASKADSREGGVGTETQIISPEVYANVSQEKFIPIVAERDEEGKSFIPTYLTSRIYIDLSAKEHFEDNYDTLLRNIYKRPAFTRPKIGKAPSHIFEESPTTLKVSTIVRNFDSQIEKNPNRTNSILRDFLDEFYSTLKDYKITFNHRDEFNYGKEIVEGIISYTPLRNEFILFLDKLTKTGIEFDIDILISFFEKLPLLKHPQDNQGSGYVYEFDNFKFYIHELFLYTVTVALKNENYAFLDEILNSSYFIHKQYDVKSEPDNFVKLYNNVSSIDNYYKETYSQNFLSPMANLIIERIPEKLTMDELINADLLCHYISVMNNFVFKWFPLTYVYRTRGRFDVFDRIVSKRHFEKVKILFNVENAEELKTKMETIQKTDTNTNGFGFQNSHDRVIPIYKLIDTGRIGSTR